MDDFTSFGETFDDALRNMERVLQRCKEANLSLSNKKYHLMMIEGIVLGHHISVQGIKVDIKKIKIIKNLPPLEKVKELRSFLGHAGYYRRFVKDFSKIVASLFYFLKTKSEYNWTPACQEAFETLKESLKTTPML